MPGRAVVRVAESPRALIADGRISWMRASVSMRISFWKPALPGASRKACSGPTDSGVGSPVSHKISAISSGALFQARHCTSAQTATHRSVPRDLCIVKVSRSLP